MYTFYIECYTPDGQQILGNLDGQAAIKARNYKRSAAYKRLAHIVRNPDWMGGKVGFARVVTPKGEIVETVGPKFRHDCTQCIYLGQRGDLDLYFCPKSKTVICRYGDDGPDYASGLPSVGVVADLTEAARRAVRMKLLPADMPFKGTTLSQAIAEFDKSRTCATCQFRDHCQDQCLDAPDQP